MIMGLYAIYDVKAGAYLSPFSFATDAMAKRGFINEVRRPDSLIGASSSDFSLYRMGTFDDSDGIQDMMKEVLMTGDEARSVIDRM